MRRLGWLALLTFLVVAAIWVWIQLFPSPEQRIRARLVDLQELVSFRASDGNLSALAGLRRLGSLFAEDARVRLDTQGAPRIDLTGRDSIMQAAGSARQSSGDFDVEFVDVTVELSEDRESATVVAVLTATEASDGEMWIQPLRITFIETDEGWLISRVEALRIFTRAGPHCDQVVQFSRGA